MLGGPLKLQVWHRKNIVGYNCDYMHVYVILLDLRSHARILGCQTASTCVQQGTVDHEAGDTQHVPLHFGVVRGEKCLLAHGIHLALGPWMQLFRDAAVALVLRKLVFNSVRNTV